MKQYTQQRKKNRIDSTYTVMLLFYKIELKLILLDAEDDDEFDDIVCSSKCVFLCNFKWTSCVKRAEHELFGHKYGLSPVCKRR